MWINRKIKTPEHNGPYVVFGVKNKYSDYETTGRFTAYWDEGINGFLDKDCEDLTYIDEGVEFWFDFTYVPNPEINQNHL